eukprot:scaffold34109_cov73-Phaeocystis_antarctica.AAC.5
MKAPLSALWRRISPSAQSGGNADDGRSPLIASTLEDRYPRSNLEISIDKTSPIQREWRSLATAGRSTHMERFVRRIALWCQLSQIAALVAPRVLTGGLTPSQQALVASVALDATGGEWQVVPVATAQRVVLFDGLDVDGDEWLLQTVAEALDEASSSALVTAGAIGDGTPLAALEAARAAHIEMYELRQPVRTRPTAWQPELARVVTNAVLDGATVEHEGASWWDVSGAVVLDGVVGEASLTQVDEALRAELLALLQEDGSWDPEAGPDPRYWERGTLTDVMDEGGEDSEGGEGGWGVGAERLEALCSEELGPVVELQARLEALLQAANRGTCDVALCRMSSAVYGDAVAPMAANAPVAADDAGLYGWHIDADPVMLPPSPWTDVYGRTPNRAPGAPRFVSALVYLSPRWDDDWGAPTRFLDTPTGEELCVPPAPGRLILMDQDITHSVTPPHAAAGERPRYSLVLKLVLHPADASGESEARVQLADPAWGEPTAFGSAAVPT